MNARPGRLARLARTAHVALLAAISASLLTATGCAAPASAPDGTTQAVDQRKQKELTEMERMGQRNDDRPLPK